MELFDDSGKADVNLVCRDILVNQKRSEYFALLSANPDWLEENCTAVLSEELLVKLVRLGKKDGAYASVIEQFVDYATPDAITDSVFQDLLSFPEGLRESMVVCLSHKSLRSKQLEVLCAANVTFECYYELAILQYRNPEYDVSALKATIEAFRASKFAEQLPVLLKEIAMYSTDSVEKQSMIYNLSNAYEKDL